MSDIPAHWIERAEAHRAKAIADRERNRREFPTVTQMVDEVRKYFPEARLVHGVEPDGREIGTRLIGILPFFRHPVSPPSGKSEAAAARPTSRSRREKPPAGEAAVSPTIRDLLK